MKIFMIQCRCTLHLLGYNWSVRNMIFLLTLSNQSPKSNENKAQLMEYDFN